MKDDRERRTRVKAPRRQGLSKHDGPIPIWQSKLYQVRWARDLVTKIRQNRAERFNDGTLLLENRLLTDRLFDLCGEAERAVRRRGGDVARDLERIDDLSFILTLIDSEMNPGIALERLEELQEWLEAMVLAAEIARLATARDTDPQDRRRVSGLRPLMRKSRPVSRAHPRRGGESGQSRL
jgi:hypothetical protein